MARGFFLTFEGLDGSGKSTQLRRLASVLAARGEQVTYTRQPGGTKLGDRIRALLLDSADEAIAPKTELALMFADRAQAIAEVIAPALERGEIVLCDRFTDSTEAYQGYGRELGAEVVLELHRAICGDLQPDLTLLLLPGLDASLARARRRNARTAQAGQDEGRFEREGEQFYQRVFEGYRAIAAREPERVVVLGGGGAGERSIEQTHTDILAVVDARLAGRTRA